MLKFSYEELALIYQAADIIAKQAHANEEHSMAAKYEDIAFKIRPMADEQFPIVDPTEFKYGE